MNLLHHIINHFTIALVDLGILFEILGLLNKRDAFRFFGWTALRLSLAFAVLSVLTGFASDSAAHIMVDEVKPVLAYHRLASYIAVPLVIGCVIMRMTMRERLADSLRGAGIRGAYMMLLGVTFFLTGVTAYLGMELTYSYGVNVEPYERILQALPPKVDQTGSSTQPTPPQTPDTLSH